MPCGGIYPMNNPYGCSCWQCGKSEPTPELFCDEWDTFLHAECALAFLNTEEGNIILTHAHEQT